MLQYKDVPMKFKYFLDMDLPAVSSPANPSANYDSLVGNLRICSDNSYPSTGISNDGNRPFTDIVWSLVS